MTDDSVDDGPPQRRNRRPVPPCEVAETTNDGPVLVSRGIACVQSMVKPYSFLRWHAAVATARSCSRAFFRSDNSREMSCTGLRTAVPP